MQPKEEFQATQTNAFDVLTLTYDDRFSRTQIGHFLRARVQARLAHHFGAGDHVLEMGCGTGEDALWLARRGVRVTATDASAAMLDMTRQKTFNQPLVDVRRLDLQRLTDELDWPTVFSGAFANFGPLNCLSNWKLLAEWLAGQVKAGGVVGLGVMSPLCLWEPVWHGLHGDWRTASRRWRRAARFQPTPEGPAISISYPTVRRLTQDFAPHFRRTHVQGIGLALPPSDVFGVVERRPRLLRLLTWLENGLADVPALAMLADHYWIEFERTAERGR